jgi:hypothetical protein
MLSALVVAVLLSATAPGGAGQQEEQSMASVFRKYGLKPSWMGTSSEVWLRTRTPQCKAAYLLLVSTGKPLSVAAARQASDELRACLDAMGFDNLIAVDIRFFGPFSQDMTPKPDTVYRGEESGRAGAAVLWGVDKQQPWAKRSVGWYARVIEYRNAELRWQKREGDGKRLVFRALRRRWRSAAWAADGNLMNPSERSKDARIPHSAK